MLARALNQLPWTVPSFLWQESAVKVYFVTVSLLFFNQDASSLRSLQDNHSRSQQYCTKIVTRRSGNTPSSPFTSDWVVCEPVAVTVRLVRRDQYTKGEIHRTSSQSPAGRMTSPSRLKRRTHVVVIVSASAAVCWPAASTKDDGCLRASSRDYWKE